MNTDISLRDLIKIRKETYISTPNIYCPFLKEIVYFNNVGFFHATHDGRGTIRLEQDARMRLNLLVYINDVISLSTGFGSSPRVRSKGNPENRYGKEVIEYELTYQFNSRKQISVILRRVGNGRLHYYSVRYTKKQIRP